MNHISWLPDWREESQYPDDVDDLQWSWEFLRRNPEYQKDFKIYGQENYNWTPETKGGAIYIQPKFSLPEDIRKKYKLHLRSSMPAPESNFPFTDHIGEYDVVRRYLIFDNSYFRYSTSQHDEEHGYFFEPIMADSSNSIAVYFELDLPLKPQFDRCVESLTKLQKNKDINTGRSSKQYYKTYLRLLDACSNNMRFSDIAEIIFPNQEGAQNKISKSIKAAKKVRDETYYFISYRSGEVQTPTIISGGAKK